MGLPETIFLYLIINLMKTRFKIILSICLVALFGISGYSQQQLVFTGIKSDTIHEFWRVNIDSPFVFDNISSRLNAIAPFSGQDFGPVSVSHDGSWYAFTSQRFDADAQGWAALTITSSDFSHYEVIRDSLGNLIHSEGLSCVFAGGRNIVFVADNGTHNRDIFLLLKNGSTWGMPRNLTATSTYAYNYWPFVSNDGKKILFDAGPTSFPSVAIGEVNIDGSGLSYPIVAGAMLNGIAAHSPCYGLDGSIIYEGDALGERIWRLPNGSLTPSAVYATYGDDNSPTTLPDGRIASLWLPGTYHRIKIMNADGTNGYLLTDSSWRFTEVFDIGLSAGSGYPLSITETTDKNDLQITPNPSNGVFRINLKDSPAHPVILEFYKMTGEKIHKEVMQASSEIVNISGISQGIYLLKVIDNSKVSFSKIIIR